MLRFFLCQLCLAAFVTSAAIASPASIKDIVVEGNQRIESSTILSSIKLTPGESVNQFVLDKIVKDLFNTGYFADVKVHRDGGKIVIAVVENPMVNQLTFEGNDEIEDDILKELIRLKPRQVYTLTKLKSDTKTLHDIYRLKGYFAAKVSPKIIRRDQNRVDVVFEIEEGEITKVEKILFVGNKAFSSSKLETAIQTKESRWYRFLTSDDTYDPDRLAYDQELLRRFYLEHGYADFRVKSAVAELTPDQKEFFITFTLEEGERYKFGELTVDSKIEKVDAKELEGLLTVATGDWYNTKEIDKSIEAIIEYLGGQGYAFVDIVPKPNRLEEEQIIGVTFEINEGPRVYINRILVKGNFVTDEDVIRREMKLFEGDAYNAHRIKQSERRIRYLGFFKKVTITQQTADAPDKVDLIVEVEEEESTGELWVAGGYNTAEGFLGDVGYRERNLLGRGQDLRLKFTLSKKRHQIDLGFTEPYFLDKPLRAGFDVFNSASKKYFGSAFEHQRTGGRLRMGYNITDYLSQNWFYELRTDRVTNVHAGASKFIQEQAGNSTTSMIGHGLSYDRRDSPINATSGYYIGMSNQLAGVGGNVRYAKNDFYGGYLYSIIEEWVLGLKANTGIMNGLGKPVRIVDRYNMGGDGWMRGFRESGVDPRDKKTLDPLGGTKYYLATAELEFPIGLPREFGVKGSIFTDIGSVWDAEEPKDQVLQTSSPRVSVGAGITWVSPIGPIHVDFARAVQKEAHDRRRTVHFGFGTRF
ncbi:MAG: outer membrane protein assembly factor BamA [Pseudomonadota bacterium]